MSGNPLESPFHIVEHSSQSRLSPDQRTRSFKVRLVKRGRVFILLSQFALRGISLCQPTMASDETHLPIGSRWQFRLKYEISSSFRIDNPLMHATMGPDSLKAQFDGVFFLNRPAEISIASAQDKFDNFVSQVAENAKNEGELMDTAGFSAAANPLAAAMDGIEGEATGSVVSCLAPIQGRSESSLHALTEVCPALPPVTYPLSWTVSGGFSPDGIRLMLAPSKAANYLRNIFNKDSEFENGWQDPRIRECGSRIDWPPVTHKTSQYKGTNPNRLEIFDLSLKYQNGEQIINKTSVNEASFSVYSLTTITLQSECPFSPFSAESIVVSINATADSNPTPNNTLTKIQLGERFREPGALLGGFTQGDPMLPISTAHGNDEGSPRMKWAIAWDGCHATFGENSCLWIDSIIVEIDLPIDVYIAKEYDPTSCQYPIVLDHEMKHVHNFRDIQMAFAAAIRKELGGSAWIPSKSNSIAVASNDIESTRQSIEHRIRETLLAGYKSYCGKLRAGKFTIDTYQEIARVDSALRDCEIHR